MITTNPQLTAQQHAILMRALNREINALDLQASRQAIKGDKSGAAKARADKASAIVMRQGFEAGR